MTRQEILEFNKLCAEFLKMEFDIHSGTWRYKKEITTELLFHSDWNWIHEIIEAIEQLRFNVRITCACITIETTVDNNSNLRTIFKFHSIGGEFETKKEAVVEAINEFLIWYNKQNK